ncbi:MAG: Rqc2 family fibronectin-binding protein [Bacillota bacterium]
MAFDGPVMAAVTRELNGEMLNSRIEKIYQPAAAEIVLLLHTRQKKARLVLSADAREARVHITGEVRENPLTPPLFCMVLRKHLEGGRIIKFAQNGLERVLRIHVEAVDELGRLAEKVLVHEIMGKHSNIILTDPVENVIIDGIKRYSHAVSRHREILPGRTYVAPPEQEKANPLTVTEETFRETVWQAPEQQTLAKALLAGFSGLSPQTCREIVARSGLAPDTAVGTCGDYELQKLWFSLHGLVRNIQSGSFRPTLVLNTAGEAVAFSAVDLTLEENPGDEDSAKTRLIKEHSSMNEVLDRYFSLRRQKLALEQQKGHLLQVVTHEKEKLAKKLAIYEETLAEAADAEKHKIAGELLTANLYQLSKGAASAEVINYYDPAGATIVVELDPQLTPVENAQLYFKKYTKARTGAEFAKSQKEPALAEVSYLDSVLTSLTQAESTAELNEIRSELTEAGYLKEKPLHRKGRAGANKDAEPLPPLEFFSSDGLTVLVGRNNRQNDRLTLRTAGPEDVWLHVRDIPGSHVIIRCGHLDEVPDRSLEEAAMLAAYYSKARASANVPVDYTLRKHVHKPRGAKPGMVIYENQRTVYVTPDEETVKKLKKNHRA